MGVGSKIEAEADIKLTLPFLSRLRFLFSSKISAEYISRIDEMIDRKKKFFEENNF